MEELLRAHPGHVCFGILSVLILGGAQGCPYAHQLNHYYVPFAPKAQALNLLYARTGPAIMVVLAI